MDRYEKLALEYLRMTGQDPEERIEIIEGKAVISRTKLSHTQKELQKFDTFNTLLGLK
jgi:hypothetical protein